MLHGSCLSAPLSREYEICADAYAAAAAAYAFTDEAVLRKFIISQQIIHTHKRHALTEP